MNCELLAPAGSFECLKQAVFGGANAVYFGAKNFNARAKADNFGEDLKNAVAFCHMYGVKAYLTLNTLVENNETDNLLEIAQNALDCGIDAFIVQDFGVVNLLKNCFDGVEIHASTQMAVNNYLGAIKAEKMGIKRVVLARETSLQDIKLIKEKTNLEIEYFIQGALCVCLSGNCFLSSKLFGKSGNKGLCLQPCRLPYTAYLKGKQIKKGYLLSAKDLCLAKRLKELASAGVDSFKIEGRLRREGYVSAVVKTYRQILDNGCKVVEDNITTLKKAFNRGDFTEAYLNGNDSIIYENIQGHKGIEIGSVIEFKKGSRFNVVKIKSLHNIAKGDVIKFVYNGAENQTITAMDITKTGDVYAITTTAFVPLQSKAYLILDFAQEQKFLAEQKKLNVYFKLVANTGQNIRLEYCFNNVCGSVSLGVCQKAENRPLCFDEAKQQLEKLGDTNFTLANFELVSDGVFVAKKELNELRRLAVSQIEKAFLKDKEVNLKQYCLQKEKTNETDEKTLEITDKENSSADFLVVRPTDYVNYDYLKINHTNAYLYIPAFLRNNDILVIDKILQNNPNLGVYAENIGALGYNRKTILGAKLNIKNIYAIKELLNKNVTAVVASPEIDDENFKLLKEYYNLPIFKAIFDGFDLMTLVHCPIKMLYKNTCANCKYADEIIYQMESGQKLLLGRYKISNCYFTLKKYPAENCLVYSSKK